MHRRTVLGLLAAGVTTLGGCTQRTVTERQTGELDVTFSTEASREVLVRLELIDADGNVEDEFESGFPPEEVGAPSYYTAGVSNGPYTVVIGTDTERESFEWSISDCPSLAVEVTVRADEGIDISQRCVEE